MLDSSLIKLSTSKTLLASDDHTSQATTHCDSEQDIAGRHYIVDFYGASYLADLELMEQSLVDAAHVAGATLLHIHLHQFTGGGGITGVALLAESHISVHSWPERDYAAFDVFMCGDAEPEKAVELLKQVFIPSRIEVKEILRGQ